MLARLELGVVYQDLLSVQVLLAPDNKRNTVKHMRDARQNGGVSSEFFKTELDVKESGRKFFLSVGDPRSGHIRRSSRTYVAENTLFSMTTYSPWYWMQLCYIGQKVNGRVSNECMTHLVTSMGSAKAFPCPECLIGKAQTCIRSQPNRSTMNEKEHTKIQSSFLTTLHAS